jgi:hypothetical protein
MLRSYAGRFSNRVHCVGLPSVNQKVGFLPAQGSVWTCQDGQGGRHLGISPDSQVLTSQSPLQKLNRWPWLSFALLAGLSLPSQAYHLDNPRELRFSGPNRKLAAGPRRALPRSLLPSPPLPSSRAIPTCTRAASSSARPTGCPRCAPSTGQSAHTQRPQRRHRSSAGRSLCSGQRQPHVSSGSAGRGAPAVAMPNAARSGSADGCGSTGIETSPGAGRGVQAQQEVGGRLDAGSLGTLSRLAPGRVCPAPA